MPSISTDARIIFWITAALAGILSAAIANVLAINIAYFFTRRGRKPNPRPFRLWMAFYFSATFSIAFGAFAAFSPAKLEIMAVTPQAALSSSEDEFEYVGRVIDIVNQQPIAGAKVTLDVQGVPPVVYTDSEGVYRFTLTTGLEISGQIRVDAEGYEVYIRNITISQKKSQLEDVRLTPGDASNITPNQTFENSSIPTPEPVFDAVSTQTKSAPPTLIAELLCSENILSHPWRLEASGMAAEDAKDFSDQYVLKNMDIVRVSYNLHGLMAQEGERKNDSTIVFNQPNWFGVSLSDYGENGLDGIQSVDIPIINFMELPDPERGIVGGRHLDLTEPISSIRARFWHRDYFLVEIIEINFCRFP